MPKTMNQPHPQFQVHDRHPALRGVAVLILGLVFVVAFLASVVWRAPEPSPETPVRPAAVRS